ncbi:class I SAM-dependent methyltransferase [Herpetosiphon llansteffanensis]|uniref:class I SAM-dependent methyltransferase n=1 Tax=Herpetosiphon llansteffanensis TaxID=2094568 RepID=UPI000D7C81E6|nr:class I SAM-dependent methyltransferase [Herpetosiphon llansteffanensis]
MKTLSLLTSDNWHDYALLDSGNGRKLERFGPVTVIRPESEALWQPKLAAKEWEAAHAIYEYQGKGENWRKLKPHPETWMMSYQGLRFKAQLTPFRHVGVFPEHGAQWDWVAEQIKRADEQPRVLNLFAYTGVASLVAAQAGAKVTHLDASKASVDWAKENQTASQLAPDSIRWIIDDALKFVRREARRGAHYEGIIMDPPAFGRGSQGQVWQFAESFPVLLQECRAILAPKPLFCLVTTYDTRASALMLANTLSDSLAGLDGTLDAGEQTLREQSAGRLLSTSIYARWSAK